MVVLWCNQHPNPHLQGPNCRKHHIDPNRQQDVLHFLFLSNSSISFTAPGTFMVIPNQAKKYLEVPERSTAEFTEWLWKELDLLAFFILQKSTRWTTFTPQNLHIKRQTTIILPISNVKQLYKPFSIHPTMGQQKYQAASKKFLQFLQPEKYKLWLPSTTLNDGRWYTNTINTLQKTGPQRNHPSFSYQDEKAYCSTCWEKSARKNAVFD